MASNQDTCVTSGPYGSIIIEPEEFSISENELLSPEIKLIFNSVENYIDIAGDITATVFLKDKNQNSITNLDFEFNQNFESRFNIQKFANQGKFTFTIPASSVRQSTIFTFRIATTPSRGQINCSTIDVDAVGSGYGFSYSYFEAKPYRGTVLETSLKITNPLSGDYFETGTELQLVAELNDPPTDGSITSQQIEWVASQLGQPQTSLIIIGTGRSVTATFSSEAVTSYLIQARIPNTQISDSIEINIRKTIPRVPVLSVESSYNFYDKDYEEIIKNSTINETILPNINLFVSEEKSASSKVSVVKSLNGVLNSYINIAGISTRVNDYFQEFNMELYNYVNNLSTDNSNNSKIRIKNINTNNTFTLFPSNYENKLILDLDKNKYNFPMFIKLYYDTTKSTPYNYYDIIKQDRFLKSASKAIASRQFNDFLKLYSYRDNSANLDYSIIDYFYYCLINEIREKNGILENLNALFNTGNDNLIHKYFISNRILDLGINNQLDFIYLGKKDNISTFNTSRGSNPMKDLFYGILQQKMGDERNFLNPSPQPFNILHNQILMYEIVKTSISDPNKQQRYYFINNFKSVFLNFIDTQLKYDTEYTYTINEISTRTSRSGQTVRLVKTIIEEIKVKVLDNPPVSPDLLYVPYKGQDNKILININSGIGTYEDYPEIIEDLDQQSFDNIRSVQNKKQNQKIKFKSDDLIDQYEVFRLEKEPENYKDFKKAFKQTFSTQVGKFKSSSASFIDSIEPNKKYYYIARSKDVHGNVSNPTVPIELEIINNNGTIYMRKKEYIFKQNPKNISKNVKRYIKIEPSKIQSEINIADFENLQSVSSPKDIENIITLGKESLGISIWDKEYLLKLISKTTGKKIDIKFKFSKSKKSFNIS